MTTPADDLRTAGLKVTAGRVGVLDQIGSSPHSDADRLHGMMLARGHSLSLQSVHNVLRDLTTANLLRRIEPANSPARYERRVGDNHHHVVCTRCDAIADVDCVLGHAPCLHPSDAAGFSIVTAEVTFWGLCADCATASSTPIPATQGES